jgi:ferredoxin-NADP reductase
MMKNYIAKFNERIQRTHNVYSFRFTTEQPFDFAPGQFARILFDPGTPSNKSLNKYLSFSNAPGKDHIEFTKKISDSEFSRKLMELSPNDIVTINGPLGNCTLTENFKKLAFLAGGIGITPAISMIEAIVTEKRSFDITVLYSNWTSADIAFKNELAGWARSSPNIRFFNILVECRPEETDCISGMITDETVKKYIPDYSDRLIYIFGPPVMVKAMQEICNHLGCDPNKMISEKFLGY